MTSPYKIALIVLYFGPLPPYFPVWLKSAEANPDVDFLVWSDQDIRTDAPNFCVRKCALTDLQERFSKTLNRSLEIPDGYKLCDYRPAYGVLFEEELRGYDFWGHCDIDLVFGRIRHFLTDETLEKYERFYDMGPFCLYRNNEKMRRAFELPGSAFTLDEMFGPLHIGMDEFVGINRICRKNRISWYVNRDYAHLSANLEKRLEIRRGYENYPTQIFYWLDGRAYRRYEAGGQIKEQEFLCVHWYIKKAPSRTDSRAGRGGRHYAGETACPRSARPRARKYAPLESARQQKESRAPEVEKTGEKVCPVVQRRPRF